MAKAAKKAKKSTSKKGKAAESEGTHLRQKAPPGAIKSLVRDIMAGKSKTSEVGQTMSTASRRAAEAGVNVPAVRIGIRFISKAKQDPIAGRVLLEDVLYCLEVCEFDKLAPPGMFTAEESGQRAPRKPRQQKQEDLPMQGMAEEEKPPAEQAASEEQPTLQ